MEQGTPQWSNRRAAWLIAVMLVLAIAVICAVILTLPGKALTPEPQPRTPKVNTLEYAAITDVEMARSLVVHPGAQLHGYRYTVDEATKSYEIYAEIYRDGALVARTGWLHGAIGEAAENTTGEINLSFGLRNDQKQLEFCIGDALGATYQFSEHIPEDFVLLAWSEGALHQHEETVTPVEIVKGTPIVLAAFAGSDTGSLTGANPANFMGPEQGRLSQGMYPYLVLLKCEFSEHEETSPNEVVIGLVENGVLQYERDITNLPEAGFARAAIAQSELISAAWPARDIATLTSAVYIRCLEPSGDGPAYDPSVYYAFSLEDGTAVLQTQHVKQFSEMDGELFSALMQAARNYTPQPTP